MSNALRKVTFAVLTTFILSISVIGSAASSSGGTDPTLDYWPNPFGPTEDARADITKWSLAGDGTNLVAEIQVDGIIRPGTRVGSYYAARVRYYAHFRASGLTYRQPCSFLSNCGPYPATYRYALIGYHDYYTGALEASLGVIDEWGEWKKEITPDVSVSLVDEHTLRMSVPYSVDLGFNSHVIVRSGEVVSDLDVMTLSMNGGTVHVPPIPIGAGGTWWARADWAPQSAWDSGYDWETGIPSYHEPNSLSFTA